MINTVLYTILTHLGYEHIYIFQRFHAILRVLFGEKNYKQLIYNYTFTCTMQSKKIAYCVDSSQ